MPAREKQESKTTMKKTAETLGKMLRDFGDSVGEIFDDPEVKENAKKFAESVTDAAVKVIETKVKDDELKTRIKNVGKAAQTLGNSLEKHF
jgi:[ribosomal protein S5]-alanine N-acetyltransferase